MEAPSRFLLFQANLPQPIRRAIWIGAKAVIVLFYLGLAGVGMYGIALTMATQDPRYTLITGIAFAAAIFNLIAFDESPEEDETTQPITPNS